MKSTPSILLLSLLPLSSWSFVTPASSRIASIQPQSTLVAPLAAKKNKKKRSSAGEGFGKSAAPTPSSSIVEDDTADTNGAAPRALQSIDNAPSTPTTFTNTSPAQDLNLDPNLSEEEKSQAILRQKFGLKSFEEQQADAGDYRALLDAEKKKEKRDKLRNIDKIWPEDKDFAAILPPGLIKGIDSFLKLGLGVCTTLFLLSGVLITIEAGSKAMEYELPAGLESFVVDVIQPGFTPGLGVLLLFSVGLGVFTIGLGSGASSTYRENP